MMKKVIASVATLFIIALIIFLSLLFSHSSNDESLPDGMSQELYDTSINVLKVMDKYNDMDINADEAENRLDTLYNKIDNMDLSDEPNDGGIWSEYERALIIKTKILSYEQALSGIGSEDTYTIADELREELEIK